MPYTEFMPLVKASIPFDADHRAVIAVMEIMGAGGFRMDLSQDGNYKFIDGMRQYVDGQFFCLADGNGRYSSNVNNSMTKGKKEMMMKKGTLCGKRSDRHGLPTASEML